MTQTTVSAAALSGLDAAGLKDVIGKLTAIYGYAGVVRALGADLRDMAEAHESDAGDYSDNEPEWADAESEYAGVLTERADALDLMADELDDARIDRDRAMEE